MKKIKEYITEKFKINSKTAKQHYNYCPENTKELKELINKMIDKHGINANLNNIDVSKITDMTKLFGYSKFNGDISQWDVSNVTNMHEMFIGSKFNGDISEWDVSNVTDMTRMFSFCLYEQDLSKWKINNHAIINDIFKNNPKLQKNPPKWYKK